MIDCRGSTIYDRILNSASASTTYNTYESNADTLREIMERITRQMEPKPNRQINSAEVKPQRITVSRSERNNNKPVTRVLWEDGEQTVVKLCDEDEAYDSTYVAFCIALAKRIYGTNNALHRVVREHTDEYLMEQQRKQKEEAREKQLAEEKLRHDRKVRRLAKRMKLEVEARNYLTDTYIKHWTEGESA